MSRCSAVRTVVLPISACAGLAIGVCFGDIGGSSPNCYVLDSFSCFNAAGQPNRPPCPYGDDEFWPCPDTRDGADEDFTQHRNAAAGESGRTDVEHRTADCDDDCAHVRVHRYHCDSNYYPPCRDDGIHEATCHSYVLDIDSDPCSVPPVGPPPGGP